MQHLNIEIKAKCADHEKIQGILKSRGADFQGEDHQIDTYFKVGTGRLKLREGNIENYLIYYERDETAASKESKIILYKIEPNTSLKQILEKSLGIFAVVDKKREIYFIDNVKFHVDTVKDLGTFMEIEARDPEGDIGKEKLGAQCEEYKKLFDIKESDLISGSYSDLILKSGNK